MTSEMYRSMLEIVTTPMCQEILRLAGLPKFRVTKDFDYRNADVAVVLSETMADGSHENPKTRFIKLKLNTFSQIEQSVKRISNFFGTEILHEDLNGRLTWSKENLGALRQANGNMKEAKGAMNQNRKIKVKVYSNFITEIIDDLGLTAVKGNDYDFLVYPDYLRDQINEEIEYAGERAIELPSHKNAPLNPIERAEVRYKILMESLLQSWIIF